MRDIMRGEEHEDPRVRTIDGKGEVDERHHKLADTHTIADIYM